MPLSKDQTITPVATTMAQGMFSSSVERPFPRPRQIQNRALHRRRQGAPKATAQRREHSERLLRGRGNARELKTRSRKILQIYSTIFEKEKFPNILRGSLLLA